MQNDVCCTGPYVDRGNEPSIGRGRIISRLEVVEEGKVVVRSIAPHLSRDL